jgi:HAD superfamily hydrolase (TIGR01509 family)
MAHQSERIEAVIFDCDGTLVDSETISLRVMSELVGEFGHEISHADAVRRFSGQDLKLVIRELESDMGRELPDDFMDRFRDRQIPCLQRELQPIVGAHELLRTLRIPFCVASNAPQAKIRVCLETTGLKRFFPDELIFSAYEIQRWKPDPTLFLDAAKRLGVSPHKCAVVEDSHFGIDAGIAAGMQTFAFDPYERCQTYGDKIARVRCLSELRF